VAALYTGNTSIILTDISNLLKAFIQHSCEFIVMGKRGMNIAFRLKHLDDD
jgi:hypothetical protein